MPGMAGNIPTIQYEQDKCSAERRDTPNGVPQLHYINKILPRDDRRYTKHLVTQLHKINKKKG